MSIPVNVFDFELLARERLSKMAYDYFAGGASDQVTVRENRAAFERIQLRPHVLRDVSQRDLSVEILGVRHTLPFIIAPMGFMGLAHPEGDVAMARGAGAAGVGLTLSTMASASLEEVAEVASTPLWFQLYVYKDRGVTRMLVERAETAGYSALVLTVDTPIAGRRELDIRNLWHLPEDVTVKNLLGSGMEGIAGVNNTSALSGYIAALWDASITWEDVTWLQSITKLPILVKGILRGDDAQLAIEHGVAGIIVSNHGGRQVDTTPATIEVLSEIVEAVNGRVELLMDGGIRRGTDIVKALALGAKAVLVGRPLVWGLAYNGAEGVQQVLELLRIEFDTAMALCGCRSIKEITPDLLRY
jgi:4-hydroxymandelate oxidase